MTTPFWCVLVAWLLAYAPKIVSSAAMWQQPGGYDNKQPRAQQLKLSGWGARAHNAHLNGLENFPPFAAAVLVAHVGSGDARRASLLAVSFVVIRVLYIAMYLANIDKLRSVLWGLGFAATGALFVLPVL